MNLVLIGPPLSGKSTLAQALAKKMGWEWVETDALIGPCREIYQQKGASYFRRKEKEVIVSLLRKRHSVIDTGGGAILDPENRSLLKELGFVIFLCVPVEVLLERMGQLPAYAENLDHFCRLIDERMSLYEEIADLILWPATYLEMSSRL